MGNFFTGDEACGTPMVAAAATSINVTGIVYDERDSLSRER